MKIFITGGTGNIGQYVTLAAIEAGHEVTVLSRRPEKYEYLSDKAKLVRGYITEYSVLKKHIKGYDAVIHIALGWGLSPVEMLKNDTEATVKLLEISEKAGVGKFIYTSSTAAMGHNRPDMNEGYSNLPLDLYGSTKSASEAYVLGFSKYFEGKTVTMKRNIIRPGYTYSNPPYPGGSTQADTRFRDICMAVKSNEPIRLTRYDGTQFISSQEIAELYMALLDSDKNEEVYLALGTAYTTWEDIAKIALELCPGSTSEIELIDKGYGDKPMLYNTDKMRRDFGLSFDSRVALREHIKWVLKVQCCP